MRAAASRTFCTAGRTRPIRTAMMAITTSSSIKVKPPRECRRAAKDSRVMGPILRGRYGSVPPGPPFGAAHSLSPGDSTLRRQAHAQIPDGPALRVHETEAALPESRRAHDLEHDHVRPLAQSDLPGVP